MTHYAIYLNEGPDSFQTYRPERKGFYLRFAYETEAAGLEQVFETDNLGGRPTAAFARSLSMGDIVHDLDADEAYVVAMVGFTRLVVDWPAVGETEAMEGVTGLRTFSRRTLMGEPFDQGLPYWLDDEGRRVYGEPHCDRQALEAYQAA